MGDRIDKLEVTVDQLRPQRIAWDRWTPVGLTAIAMLLGAVAWLFTAIAGKADASEVRGHALKLEHHSDQLEQLSKHTAWMEGAIWELAKHSGVPVPPPPPPQP